MKFNFKIQQFQTDAVQAVTDVFAGQSYRAQTSYIRDLGKINRRQELDMSARSDTVVDAIDDTGFKNDIIELTDDGLIGNIHRIQTYGNIKPSPSLVKDFGRCSLDIEMETGTGKTYVYIKTMFELNKLYGWSKFIVVVPSIAIREGVNKTFEITADHFMEHYGKKARFFIYNSSNLNQLDTFSSSSDISVMIINTQAFAASLKEGGRSKESRIIYDKRDEFASRRPIDVIKANRPIIIRDEPQKMGGEVTTKALKGFNPLFCLNYSATHEKKNNMVYVLDALDAYNKRLVKKIEVKGVDVKNLKGTEKYLYLENIMLSSKKPPVAKLEIEVKRNSGIKRETMRFDVGDKLYEASNELEQYQGYVVSDIEPQFNRVTFSNGEVIEIGEAMGDMSESDKRRIQIRETILSHFEKEETLFDMGIKTLSLFFIDEVAKYRMYGESGEELEAEYKTIFEEEYLHILNERLNLMDTPYQKYLREMCSDVSKVHQGYFSIDKKTKLPINSTIKRGSESSDDISAYELILSRKEVLLSFDHPTRFIFSHSALREGWDNPNVFQICTLKHSDSSTVKRQEVGRGLRLCVNQSGNRMDEQTCGDDVHAINKLTVVASESYGSFVSDLQSTTMEVLYDRPKKATQDYFTGKTVFADDIPVVLDDKHANKIYKYLVKNDYIDDDDNVTELYRTASAQGSLAPLHEDLQPMAEGVHKLIQAIFDESVLKEMFENANTTKVRDNPLNSNYDKKEFQALWNNINNKYAYTASFDSEELITKAISHVNEHLHVSEVMYTTTVGEQRDKLSEHNLERGDAFESVKSRTQVLKRAETSNVKYDLIGKVATGTKLTRKTVVRILKGISPNKLAMFAVNPEEFISKIVRLINEQKATIIVEHVTYCKLSEKYDKDIFTVKKSTQPYEKAFKANRHIQDYVFTDGTADKSVERKFAEALDIAEEVCVYAKLPRDFKIPTPVGNYAPDWAIAFNEGSVKHIFFVAETKGTMETLELRPIEQAKITCAKKLFNDISTSKVRYHDVDSYESLLKIMSSID